MLRLFIYLYSTLLSLSGYAQSLEGEWHGYLQHDNSFPSYENEQKLYFRLLKDSTYQVYSYCKGVKQNGEDTIVIAKIIYHQPSSDSIYLQEVEVLKPKDVINNCLVNMRLKISSEEDLQILSGKWTSDCDAYGNTKFRRKRK